MKNSTIPPNHPSVALSATDTNSSAFHDIYSQLPHSDSVRILVLLPADDPDAELQGTLSTTRLSDCQNEDTSYVTLSYVWGQQKHTGVVRIDEIYLHIGENLFDALRHLRRRDKSLRLWADALCINQFNLEERNHQVQNMRDIYASSSETVIYLGNDDGGTTNLSAWNLLESLSIWALNDQGNKDFDRPSKLQQSLTKFKGSIEDVEISVLSQPWFSRVWVLQEVVVSKAVSIQCGPRGIPWNDFCKIILLQPRCHDRYGMSLRSRERVDTVQSMFQARCAYQASRNLLHLRPQWYSEVPNFRDQSDDVVEMLVRARQLEASDPRDKVFALLGISRDIELDDPRLTIDYNKHPARVYADFARFVIGTTESFDLLSHVNHFVYFFPCYFHPELSQSQSVPNFSSPYGWLPSWVPNWNGSESARKEEANRRKAGAKLIRSSLAWSTMGEGAYYPFDMKEVIGCYDPECTMDNVQPSGFLGPTILSTLPEETVEAQAYRRIIARANMRWAGIENMRFEVIGSYIGHVKFVGPWILLRGQDEAGFQKIRDALSHSPEEMRRQIISRWRCFLVQKQNGNWTNAQMDPDMPGVLKWPHIDWCLLDDNPDLGAEAIESHLFARGKQTAVWSSSAGNHFVYDKSSVIDGKRIGTFGNLLKHGKILSRVILPPAACVGDFIVSFHGGRVPFVIRRAAEPSRYTSEDLKASQGFGSVPSHTESSEFCEGMPFERCKFVGECLINDFEHWNDCIKDQKVIFGMH